MYLTYDSEADAAYIYFKSTLKKGEIKKTVDINQDIFLDLDRKGRILGLEGLEAKKKLDKKLMKQAIQIGKKRKEKIV